MASDTTDARRYRIRGVLGRGGFGTVYLADMLGQSGFTRTVALKVLNPDVENVPTIAARLRDEARLLGMLRHRAIVAVEGLVRLDDRWTIVMEYVAGVSLARVLSAGALPPGPALELTGEVAGALSVAYETDTADGNPLHLLHRDIKPQNILVTATGETKVLDFGVARATFAGRETHTQNLLLGSVGYVAPERYDFDDGPAADVYALGVVLWELLTAKSYGRASTQRGPFDAHRAERIAQLGPGVPASVRALVSDMLAFTASERPTARAVEGRCRDLRLEVRGHWLRDWAEHAVPPLLLDPNHLEHHDFSEDVLSEATAAADLLPKRPLSTFTPDFLDEAPPPPPPPRVTQPPPPTTTPPAPPEPPAPTPPPPAMTWTDDVGALASARPPRSRPRRAPRRGPGGCAIFLQAFGGISLILMLIAGGLFLFFTVLCCLGAANS